MFLYYADVYDADYGCKYAFAFAENPEKAAEIINTEIDKQGEIYSDWYSHVSPADLQVAAPSGFVGFFGYIE